MVKEGCAAWVWSCKSVARLVRGSWRKFPRRWLAARRGKLLSEAMPATTGARAAGTAGGEGVGEGWGARAGNGGVRGVGEVLEALHGVAVHAGAEGGADGGGGAAEFDEGAGGVDLNAGEVVV